MLAFVTRYESKRPEPTHLACSSAMDVAMAGTPDRMTRIKALAGVSHVLNDFKTDLCTITVNDDSQESQAAYRSLSAPAPAAQEGPTSLLSSYDFMKNPSGDMQAKCYEPVERMMSQLSQLRVEFEKNGLPIPRLQDTIDEESTCWFGYEMCKVGISNAEKMQTALIPSPNAAEQMDECPICMDDLTTGSSGTEGFFATTCHHRFCRTCWDAWCREFHNMPSVTCPLCRAPQTNPRMPQDDEPQYNEPQYNEPRYAVLSLSSPLDEPQPRYRSLAQSYL